MATVVSAYYIIPSKKSHDTYSQWIKNFMDMNMNTFIFVDETSHAFLSGLYPESETRKYCILPFESFVTSQFDWSYDESIDTEKQVGHSARLYQVWNEKPFFMKKALEVNPYNSKFYVWVDIGCFRDASMIQYFKGFPSPSKCNPERIQFFQIDSFKETEKQNTMTVDARFQFVNRLGGTMFSCPKKLIETFASLHMELLKSFDEKKLFKGKDQSLFNFAVLQLPDLFQLIKRPSNPIFKYDPWFYLHEYLCETTMTAPLRIVIVGPGVMPIPPTGWGAVEILVWDYAKALERQGHSVVILNDPDLNKVVQEIRSIRPDVVHIQYENHAHISGAICQYTKLIGITSHFAYLEQVNRWGGYSNVFNSVIKQKYNNVYYFVLSNGIAHIYRMYGADSNKIVVCPNGANEALFRFSDKPEYPNRSIYLAKIDYRKRQHMFQSIDSLYFAGNNTDHNFNTSSPRYLGEWNKEYLYENLTNYGNLVLLSDGEADPLVVKEAFLAGLGVVISQWSTANLDLTKPYITVISEEKISDVAYVEAEIIKNREISLKSRDEIRKYGLTFTWDILIKKYVENINKII